MKHVLLQQHYVLNVVNHFHLVQILFFFDAEINLPVDVERYRFISWTFCLAGVATIIP